MTLNTSFNPQSKNISITIYLWRYYALRAGVDNVEDIVELQRAVGVGHKGECPLSNAVHLACPSVVREGASTPRPTMPIRLSVVGYTSFSLLMFYLQT